MNQKDSITDLKKAIIDGNATNIVHISFNIAAERGASDIHIESGDRNARIRFRVDGVLEEIAEYPLSLHPSIVSRVKILSNLKIDETRKPQDGRINIEIKNNKELDLRVSTLPTITGEKIVMRIVDKSQLIPHLHEFGIQGNSFNEIKKAIEQPNGILLTSGPTGSGKTTTLYSCLSHLNKPGVNILTIEDPVENQINGLNQSQVNPEIGYTFASGLRTSLRQDPNIIMVGEIRDRETIDIAIEAALTGHLVLSTIHTNSAAKSITRILNMGLESFLIPASMNAIIAQRLVRKVCTNCKEYYKPTEAIFKKIKESISQVKNIESEVKNVEFLKKVRLTKGVGCEVCAQTGYKGRLGIYEVLPIDNEIGDMIVQGFPDFEIEKKGIEKGMVTLEQYGIFRALEGETTLEEVYSQAKAQV